MIRLTGEVMGADGSTRPVEVMQAEFAAWELYALRLGLSPNPEGAPPITMLRYLAFAAEQRGTPRRDWPDFEDWWAGVVNVDLDADQVADAVDAAMQGSAGAPVFPPVRSAG